MGTECVLQYYIKELYIELICIVLYYVIFVRLMFNHNKILYKNKEKCLLQQCKIASKCQMHKNKSRIYTVKVH